MQDMQDIKKQLLSAIAANKEPEAVFYLEVLGEVDINSIVDEKGNTLLHLAVKQGMPKLIDELLKRKIDILYINDLGETAEDLCTSIPGRKEYIGRIKKGIQQPEPKPAQVERKVPAEMLFMHELEREGPVEPTVSLPFVQEPMVSQKPLEFVQSFISKDPKCLLSECECCPQLCRSLGKVSLRDTIDEVAQTVANQGWPPDKVKGPVVLMSIGSGRYKQLATTVTNLMMSGRDVELILVDHVISEKPEAARQFREFLEYAEKRFGKKASIIGQFSSLEVYKSIMNNVSAPKRLRSGKPSEYEADIVKSKLYQEEYDLYKNTSKKIPQIVTVIDDVTTVGNIYDPIIGGIRLTSDDEWSQFKEYRKIVYREDIVKELAGLASKYGTKANDRIVFITTEKAPMYDGGFSVCLRANAVKSKEYLQGESESGVKKPGHDLEQVALYEQSFNISKDEKNAFKEHLATRPYKP